MRKKIILSVTNDLVTDQRLNKVATSLANAGYDVLLIGRRFADSPGTTTLSHNSKRFNLIFNSGPLFYFEYNFYLFVYLLFSNFDILLSNDLDTLPANFLASRLRGKVLVYDSHEYFTEVPELVGRPEIKRIWEKIESRILPLIKHAYTVCGSIADIYKNKYGINMRVVRNVPLCSLPVWQGEIKFNPAGKKLVIYQGALNIGRGIEHVIKAMKYVDGALFLIIGDGDISGELRNLVTREKLEDKVVFTGRIIFNQLSAYTKLADLGISLEEDLGLNYYYALPNKLFDYIKAEVPVLASDLPEIKEIVEGNDIGITIKNKNPEYIAEKIDYMLNNKPARINWKSNLKKIQNKYCWEKEEKVLLKVFEGIGSGV